MARKPSRASARAEAARRLEGEIDALVSSVAIKDEYDIFWVAQKALEHLPNRDALTRGRLSKFLTRFDEFSASVPKLRERLDPVEDPETTFDPSNPDIVGRLVVIGLLAQERVPLSQIRPTYGSGVYALYYLGDHPTYAEITGTETPIYVGKADPDAPQAASAREQGIRLFTRLTDHRNAIREVETYAANQGAAQGLRVEDFDCRRLICATNAQLVAERHLIDIFKPAWNYETKICYGISKHGDSATTRGNRKSPWDVLHPGRSWAMSSPVRAGMTPESISHHLATHFSKHVPRRDRDELILMLLDTFRQIGRTDRESSEAAANAADIADPSSDGRLSDELPEADATD